MPRHGHRLTPLLLVAAIAATAAAGCGGPRDDAAAQTERLAAAEAAAAGPLEEFERSVAEEKWALAKAQGAVLVARHPGTEAARKVEALLPEVTEKSDIQREAARTEALWAYDRIAAGRGEQVTAAIYAKDPVDTDGSGPRRVRLIFRDHPDWGRSSYLVLERGDFDCYGGCRVNVTVDDAAAERLPASRPDTDEAIAMFIEDHRGLWRRFKDADTVSIEFPVKAGGMRTVVFETAGLKPDNMPERWN
ncbi:MAG: hypothetical protein Q4F49_01785 [Pseudoxanthomonas suwonensis]|nr:hypothetical protein [Pseudoxanthomonas suwonensis]